MVDYTDFEGRRGSVFFARRDAREYQICTRCIMDTSDAEITFDADGVCHHCHDYEQRLEREVLRDEQGAQHLGAIVAQIKREGEGKPYDCVIGLSGGVDSTYVAYLCKQLGLRPLAIHLDNGWNSEIAVRNIEAIVRKLGIDLYTHVLDWEEFRNLQLAFLRASTPDSEIPTDHAIVATLYQLAAKHGVRWVVEGSNVVTEAMCPITWSFGHSDWGYIKALNDRFSPTPLETYPHYTFWDLNYKLPLIKRIVRFPILNYIDFDKPRAMEIMKRELDWQPYGGKHYESIYTRFFQGYILPEKFGFDKRRPHLSCLVNAGNLTRDEALAEVAEPAIEPEQLREDRAFAIKKLGITEDEFEAIMTADRKTFWDYPSDLRDMRKSLRYDVTERVFELYRSGWKARALGSVSLASVVTKTCLGRSLEFAKRYVGLSPAADEQREGEYHPDNIWTVERAQRLLGVTEKVDRLGKRLLSRDGRRPA